MTSSARANRPEGDAGLREPTRRGGRKVVPRMPVQLKDGSVVRPRAKGSRASQPPVKRGLITGALPLSRPLGDLPYRAILSRLGAKVREYRRLTLAAEQIWQEMESLERDLGVDGPDVPQSGLQL